MILEWQYIIQQNYVTELLPACSSRRNKHTVKPSVVYLSSSYFLAAGQTEPWGCCLISSSLTAVMEAVIRATEWNPLQLTYTCFSTRSRVKPAVSQHSSGFIYTKPDDLCCFLIRLFTLNNNTGIRQLHKCCYLHYTWLCFPINV